MNNIEELAAKVIASCDASIAKCEEILATLKRMEERGKPEPAPEQVWRWKATDQYGVQP